MTEPQNTAGGADLEAGVDELDRIEDALLTEAEGGAAAGGQEEKTAVAANPDPAKPAEAAKAAEEEDVDKFLTASLAEVGKTIPKGFYDRFKRERETRKQFEKRVKDELEPLTAKHGELEKRFKTREENFLQFERLISQHPYLDRTLEALIKKNKLDPADLQGLQEMVQAELEKLAAGGEPARLAAGDPRVQEILDWKNRQEAEKADSERTRVEENLFKADLKLVRKADGPIQTKYPGVEVDDDFLEELGSILEDKCAVADRVPGTPKPSVLAIAETVARRRFGLRERLLAKAGAAIPQKKAAGLERANAPAGEVSPTIPPLMSREFDAWAADPRNAELLATMSE